jgi:predicted Zn-dependent protease
MALPPQFRRLAIRAAFFYCVLAFTRTAAFAQDDRLALESRQAKQLMSEGRFTEAIPMYEELVRAVPGNPGLILNLGLAQLMAGRPADAIPQFETVLKSDPANVPALTSVATARLQLNQPRLAIAPLQKLVGLQADNRDARGMLAGALMGVGRFSEAAAQYRKLSAVDAGDAKAWYGLGKAYEELAAASFEQLEKVAPESAYVLSLVGDSQLSRGQYRSAFFFYKQAAEKKNDLPGLHAGLAEVYGKTGHDDWAAQEKNAEANLAKSACTAHPAECHFRAARYLQAAQGAGNTPESLYWATKAYNALAVESFDRLGKLPESVELHALKADILRGHRQYQEAVNEWRAALKLSPEDKGLRHELASALFQAGDYKAAIPIFETELREGHNAPDTNFMLGDSFLRMQEPEKSIGYLETALRLSPGMKPADASLGLALALMNRQAEAIPHLEKALDIDDDGSLHYQLARAYQAKGNAARAKELLSEYQKIQARNQEHKDEVAREAQITAPSR